MNMQDYMVSAYRNLSTHGEAERVPPFIVFADSDEEAVWIAARVVGRGLLISTLTVQPLRKG